MPYLHKRGCAYPGCPRMCDKGTYCEEHRKIVGRQYEKYSRDPETKKRYGRSWQKIRDLYASTHPLCERCLERGVVTMMDHVHHKIPLSEGGSNDFDNLQSLCKPCHTAIHDMMKRETHTSCGGGAV